MEIIDQSTIPWTDVESIDNLTAKNEQLRSLLAVLAVAIDSGDLPTEHLSNAIWLASDIAASISDVLTKVFF